MTDTTPQLSEREREILAYVANGSTNQQIANDLGISVNTVKVHVRNIFGKIGVASRAEATLYAVRTGIVSVDIAQPAVAVVDDDDPPSNGEAATTGPTPAPVSPTTPAHPAPPSEVAPITPSAPPRSNRPIVWLAIAGIALLVTIGLVVFATQSSTPPVAPTQPSVPTVPQGSSGPGSGPVVAAPRPQWQLLKPLGAAQRAAAASITGGMMYVLGGANGTGVTNAVWQYNPESDTWRAQANKPTAVQHVHGAVLNGKIHVPGGELADGSVSDVLEIFDPAQNTWSAGASLPAPRSGYGLVAFEGKLYLIGGWDGSAVTDTTFVYDPDRDAWSVAEPMTTARAYMGTAVADGQIFVFGGVGPDGQALAQGEIYDPTREAWRAMASPLPTALSHFALAPLGEYLIVLGGREVNSPLYFNFRRDSWEIYQENEPLSPLGEQPAVAVRDNLLYVLSADPAVPDSSALQQMRVIYTMVLPFNTDQ